MGNRQTISFNNKYPDDVIGLILMKVDVLTLTSCPQVCRQFARVLRSSISGSVNLLIGTIEISFIN